MLVDIVSKNGNLLINIVQTPEGDLEPDVVKIVEEIAMWTSVNGEGIYGSRPWKVYGEKPSNTAVINTDNFNEDKVKYSAADIRFTTRQDTLYAFCLDKPAKDVHITSLGKNSTVDRKIIKSVKMLGSDEKLHWKQEGSGLVIKKPLKLPVEQVPVIGFRIEFK